MKQKADALTQKKLADHNTHIWLRVENAVQLALKRTVCGVEEGGWDAGSELDKHATRTVSCTVNCELCTVLV